MSRRIDARELLAAIGGVLVLIGLFLEWYEPDRGAVFAGNGITGWEAFEALDLVLAGLALAAVATGAQSLGTLGSLGSRALLPLGALLLIIVAVQLASPPPVAWGADVAVGGWLALAGSLVVLAAGLLRAARINISVDVAGRESRRRVAAVDKRPAAGTAPPRDTAAAAGRADATLSGATAAPPPPGSSPQPTQPFKSVDGA